MIRSDTYAGHIGHGPPNSRKFCLFANPVLAAGRFGRYSTNDMPVHRGSHGGNHADIASSTVDHSAGGSGPGGDGRDGCLIHASFGTSELQNADSARLCRFRKSQQKRASDLDSINGWIPELDVTGSLVLSFWALLAAPERYLSINPLGSNGGPFRARPPNF